MATSGVTINVQLATESDFQTLKGIGPTKAKTIVKCRQEKETLTLEDLYTSSETNKEIWDNWLAEGVINLGLNPS